MALLITPPADLKMGVVFMRHLSFCVEEERMLLSIDLDFMTAREKNKLIAHIQHQININQCNKDVAVDAIKTIRKSFERS